MKTRYKLLSIIAFLILFFCGLSLLYRVFSWKDTSGDYFSSVNQMYGLNKNTVDVAFFGPSTTYSGLNPAIFWENNGIAAFNAAVSGQDRNASTYYVKELLKYQSPKVIILSAMYFYVDYYAVEGNLLRNTLSLKESLNSVGVINELVKKNESVTGGNELKDFYLRWPIVHSRYRELKKQDFVPVREYENSLGYVYDLTIGGLEDLGADSTNVSESTPISDENRKWIDDLKKLSDEKGVQILVVSTPTVLSATQRACLNGCYEYLEKLGIPYLDLNFCLNEMDYIPNTDMTDLIHANMFGAKKISAFLSDYLSRNYVLPDRRGQKGYERFELCLENYRRKCMEIETLPSADATMLLDYAMENSEVTFTITLHPACEPFPDFIAFLQDAGVSLDEINAGGTWVFQNGTLLRSPSMAPYGCKLNSADYLIITPTDELGSDQISLGRDVLVSPDAGGSIMVIYDGILDKIVSNRTFD